MKLSDRQAVAKSLRESAKLILASVGYHYYSNCTSMSEGLVDWIRGNSRDLGGPKPESISYEEFLELVPESEFQHQEPDYPPIGEDWHVGFYTSTTPSGIPVAYYTHSGIEWVFVPKGARIDSTAEDELISKAEDATYGEEDTKVSGSAELQNPNAQKLLNALKHRPSDPKALAKATGLGLPATRAFLTRLVFLGAVMSNKGTYSITDVGKVALGIKAGLHPVEETSKTKKYKPKRLKDGEVEAPNVSSEGDTTNSEIPETMSQLFASMAFRMVQSCANVLSSALYTDESGKFWGNQGAGAILVAEDTGRFLLQKRSSHVNEPRTFGVVGGAVDVDEDPEEAMQREVREETGYKGPMDSTLIYTFQSGKFKYSNYAVKVPHEFEPHQSWEAEGYQWCTLDSLPEPLHFGVNALMPFLKDWLKANNLV